MVINPHRIRGGKVPVMYTHDRELIALQRVAWRSASIEIRYPLAI